eukprot:762970-Hanusia_phi.AAC.1
MGESMKRLLSKLGCRMLDREYISRPEALRGYVQSASLQGVMTALLSGNGGSVELVCERVSELSGSEKRELRAYCLQQRWFQAGEEGDGKGRLVIILPVHEVHGRETSFVGISWQQLPPGGVPERLLTSDYLRADEGESRVYHSIGIRTAKLHEFYSEGVLPRLGEMEVEVCEESVHHMLANLPQICREDKGFWERLRDLEFIPTASGKLARAQDLYDPSVEELQDLLEGGEFYPAKSFTKPELIGILLRLGLRTSLDRSGVVQVAYSISRSDSSMDLNEVIHRAKKLVLFLSKNPGLLWEQDESFHSFRSELLELSWVPVMQASPSQHVPWLPQVPLLDSPLNARPHRDLPLASSSATIASIEDFSPELEEFLGWQRAIPARALVAQLVGYGKMFQDKSFIDPMMNSTEAFTLPQEVKTASLQLYDMLCMHLHELEGNLSSLLKNQPSLLLPVGFVCPSRVAFECNVDCAPLLYR